MNLKKIIKIIMTMRGLTNQTLSEKCGYTTASGISNMLGRDNGMRIDNLLKIMDAMECEVIVRTKTEPINEWKIEEGK